MKIYCPKCNFEPTPDTVWTCRPGCGHAWNTFLTQGQCPNCFKWWKWTQCPECDGWSLHVDWYHDGLPAELVEEEEKVDLPSAGAAGG